MTAGGNIIVVTGLPRSGTSMMMRMLEAGGIRLLTDGARAPDRMNPHGYFEYRPVRDISHDTGFLSGARGMAIKIVIPLVGFLPEGPGYKVIVMRRDLAAIAASQAAMARARGHVPPVELHAVLERHLSAARAQLSRLAHIELDYECVVADPIGSAREIESFLTGPLDVEAMARMVDHRLAGKT
jgi:hypothetical protein